MLLLALARTSGSKTKESPVPESLITLPEIDSPLVPTLATGEMKMRKTAGTPVISTLWLSFADENEFKGVAIVDVVEGEDAAEMAVIKSIRLSINPGPDTSVLILNMTNNPLIKPEHKNRLILDEELLLKLGRRPLYEADAHARCPCSACLAAAA
jgi:hypothetical protein